MTAKAKEPYWTACCRAARSLHKDGLVIDALEYLVEGKFFPFVMREADKEADLSLDALVFANEVRSIFKPDEISKTLKKLNRGQHSRRYFSSEGKDGVQKLYNDRREVFEKACEALGFQEISQL